VIICHHQTVTSTGADTDDLGRQQLAELVRNRRIDRHLSVRQAAETAGVARNTWAAVEDGTRRLADNNYAGIEKALAWQSGSIADILRGGTPTELPATAVTATPPGPQADDADEALIRVMRSDIPDHDKARIVRLLIQERERARQQLLKMADDLLAGPS
jgi:transcriptional regulator with XRE-family HTH domain